MNGRCAIAIATQHQSDIRRGVLQWRPESKKKNKQTNRPEECSYDFRQLRCTAPQKAWPGLADMEPMKKQLQNMYITMHISIVKQGSCTRLSYNNSIYSVYFSAMSIYTTHNMKHTTTSYTNIYKICEHNTFWRYFMVCLMHKHFRIFLSFLRRQQMHTTRCIVNTVLR